MSSRPYVLAFVAAGCMAAAGLGAYIAVRQNTAPAVAGPVVNGQERPTGAAVPGAVAETEAQVEPPAPAAPPPQSTPAPAPDPAPAPKRIPTRTAR